MNGRDSSILNDMAEFRFSCGILARNRPFRCLKRTQFRDFHLEKAACEADQCKFHEFAFRTAFLARNPSFIFDDFLPNRLPFAQKLC